MKKLSWKLRVDTYHSYEWAGLVLERHLNLMTDEQAMWRVQMNGDNAAFAYLVDRWETPIHRLCYRMLGNYHQGEDLKQEVFARVFVRRKAFRQGARFSTWLWRIALNLCYDELRKVRGHKSSAEPEQEPTLPVEEPSPDKALATEEDCELVRRAILRLPETNRSALVLRYCEGLKLREVAEILEIPETTASSRIAVGLAQITRILEPQFTEKNEELSQSKIL